MLVSRGNQTEKLLSPGHRLASGKVTSPLEMIPDDVLCLKILSFLPINDRTEFTLTQRKMYNRVQRFLGSHIVWESHIPTRLLYVRPSAGEVSAATIYKSYQVRSFRYIIRRPSDGSIHQLELKLYNFLWFEYKNVKIDVEQAERTYVTITVSRKTGNGSGATHQALQPILCTDHTKCCHGRKMNICKCGKQNDGLYMSDELCSLDDLSWCCFWIGQCVWHIHDLACGEEEKSYPSKEYILSKVGLPNSLLSTDHAIDPSEKCTDCEKFAPEIFYRPARSVKEWQRYVPCTKDVPFLDYDLHELPWYHSSNNGQLPDDDSQENDA